MWNLYQLPSINSSGNIMEEGLEKCKSLRTGKSAVKYYLLDKAAVLMNSS